MFSYNKDTGKIENTHIHFAMGPDGKVTPADITEDVIAEVKKQHDGEIFIEEIDDDDGLSPQKRESRMDKILCDRVDRKMISIKNKKVIPINKPQLKLELLNTGNYLKKDTENNTLYVIPENNKKVISFKISRVKQEDGTKWGAFINDKVSLVIIGIPLGTYIRKPVKVDLNSGTATIDIELPLSDGYDIKIIAHCGKQMMRSSNPIIISYDDTINEEK